MGVRGSLFHDQLLYLGHRFGESNDMGLSADIV